MLMAILTMAIDDEDADYGDVFDNVMADLALVDSYHVTLAAVGLITDLCRQLGRWTGDDPESILRNIALAGVGCGREEGSA